MVGYNIKGGSVTYDGFQSVYQVQLLEKNKYDSYHISVDRTDGPYLDLVNMFYENRITLRDHKTSRKELFELIHDRDRGKVDHPSDGSKDLIDSLCGCVQAAIRSEYFRNMSVQQDFNPNSLYIDAEEFLRIEDERIKKEYESKLDYIDVELINIAKTIGGM